MPAGPKTEFLYEMVVDLEAPYEVGDTPRGRRRVVLAAGGTFSGPRLRGVVLPGSADWLIRRADGAWEVDVRATLRTDDGSLIYVHYPGLLYYPPDVKARRDRGEPVDPGEYYFRVTPRYETAAPAYEWLNQTVAVGVGERTATGVAYAVYALV